MKRILFFSIIYLVLVFKSSYAGPYSEPHFVDGRGVIVQLMDWKFSEIAKECEEFLGPFGYGGVQLSPVQACSIITVPFRPWSERYSIVSYKIIGRSGNEEEMANMVDRCNKVGVRIFVDIVTNHMTGGLAGKGTDGTYYDGNAMNYPGVPFTSAHFHGHESCPTSDLEIHDYDDPIEARNCRLVTLRDLDQAQEYVRAKQAEFINKLIDMGVAGFRSDASKHMWPSDLTNIYSRLHNLNTKYFPANSRPFFAHEFIVGGGTRMHPQEYLSIGRVIEFRYFEQLAKVLRKRENQLLKKLQNFGEGWLFLKGDDALVMIDSHDLQRGHTGTLGLNIAYYEPRLLKMATAFMLAFPYGIPRVMSSYYWQRDWQTGPEGLTDKNDWMGPPNNNGEIRNVTRNADLSCNNNEWICEHRWREIFNMVKFRNVVQLEPLTNWWDNGWHAIAFGRGDKGFIVINNEDYVIDNTFQTGLPAGQYCDVITGNKKDGKCEGKTITVSSDGKAHIYVNNKSDNPMVAIHIKEKL